ncbi:hypothetical protein MNBD_CHLOROFLEXI01-1855 [hydrothermal vent metagenome]|uniref:Uncharacterized protein n=1 Tax=hydrothermal vent metagenome TaxID=652676 RepID=A0A3B0W7M8_9ZZZZ
MTKRKALYKSYLLRLWCEGSAHSEWRVMVETITGDNERRHFANLDELFQFLLVEVENGWSPNRENCL